MIGKPCRVCGARTDGSGRCPAHPDGAGRLARPCAGCGRRIAAGPFCAACAATEEGERQGRQPYRVGYRDPDYHRNAARARKRAGGRCELCGAPFTDDDPAEVDHIVSLSEGGTNDPGNLRVIHRSENQQRRRRPRKTTRRTR